jgi:hypothetical protein
MAPRLGFEPKLLVPETSVLPLDDLGIMALLYHKNVLNNAENFFDSCLFVVGFFDAVLHHCDHPFFNS